MSPRFPPPRTLRALSALQSEPWRGVRLRRGAARHWRGSRVRGVAFPGLRRPAQNAAAAALSPRPPGERWAVAARSAAA